MMIKSKSAYEGGKWPDETVGKAVCYYAFIQCFLSFDTI